MAKQIRELINTQTPLGDVPSLWRRFIEAKVYRSEYMSCWTWIGRTSQDGYGSLYIPVDLTDARPGKKRKLVAAHRFAAQIFWEFDEGDVVYRTCNVVNCVNPNHFVVTYRNGYNPNK